jgi:hypothetical protein
VTTEKGSEELGLLCARVADDLVDFSGRLLHRDTTYMQHVDHAARAGQLGESLRAVLALTSAGSVPQSLALARTVMERWGIDTVILLGDRYVERYPGTTEMAFSETIDRWERGELESVLERPELIGQNRSTMRIVRRGLNAQGAPDRVLHPLYFEIDRFDPFFGPPDDQPDLVGGALLGDPRRTAERHRQRYNASMRWSAVVDSLEVNRLLARRHRVHLRVHYRFLSAFVHGQHAAYRSLETSRFRSRYSNEHIGEELALLYVAQFGARYLQSLLQMCDRPPPVEIDERKDLEALALELLSRTQHLWFLHDEPSMYDRGQEMLDRAVRSESSSDVWDPMALPPQEIRYYRNPIDRLARLHETSTEMVTRFTYTSPW